MDPLQIALIVLALAAIWAVIELALVIRRARGTVDTLDKTLGDVNEAIAETRPVIAKIDEAIDELQPALAQIEPVLKNSSIAVEALSADLVEINGVLRDVSSVTGSVSTASDAVSGMASVATEKVSRLFGKRGPAAPERTLAEPGTDAEPAAETGRVVLEEGASLAEMQPASDAAPEADPSAAEAPSSRYYTYTDDGAAAPAKEETHE